MLSLFYEAIQLDVWTPALNHRRRNETYYIFFLADLFSLSNVLITVTWL